MKLLLEFAGKFDLFEPNCSGDQSVNNGPTALHGGFEFEARHYFGECQVAQHSVQADERVQRLIYVPSAN
jgi:hypothetical protein